MTPPPSTAALPDRDQVQAHLDAHTPTAPSPWRAWTPIAVMIGAFVFAMLVGGPAWLAPWAALLGALFLMRRRMDRLQRIDRRVTGVQELVLYRRWREAVAQCWRLLPETRETPTLHGRVVSLLAHSLDLLQAPGAALAAYESLLQHVPGHTPVGQQLEARRVLTLLQDDRLTEAISALRRVEAARTEATPPGVIATTRLARLWQQTTTNNFADIVSETGDVMDQLRPLGVEAGFGFALVAVAHAAEADRLQRQSEETDDGSPRPGRRSPDALRDAARLWWERATLLIAERPLIDRLPHVRSGLAALAAASSDATAPPAPDHRHAGGGPA